MIKVYKKIEIKKLEDANLNIMKRLIEKPSCFNFTKYEFDFKTQLNYSENLRRIPEGGQKKMKIVKSMYFPESNNFRNIIDLNVKLIFNHEKTNENFTNERKKTFNYEY